VGRLRLILMATRDNTSALEKDGHGFMTRLLLKALRGEVQEVLDGEGRVNIVFLTQYLEREMQIQPPILWIEGNSKPCILAHYPKQSARFLRETSRDREDMLLSKLDKITSPHFFEKLTYSSHVQPFDHETPSDASLADLDLVMIADFFKRDLVHRQQDFRSGLPDQDQLVTFDFLSKSCPRYGALLCFGQNPQKWLSGSLTRCIHWRGNTRNDGWLDDQEIRGNLLKQFEFSSGFLRKCLRFSRLIDQEGRTEQYEVPFIALEEALANTLVHREYTNRTDFIQIEVFDDRIEFRSPGDLPSPMTLDLLGVENKCHPRNPIIARIFYLYGYVEKVGSGIQRMQDAMKKADLPPPKLELSEAKTLTVTLYRPHQISDPTSASTIVELEIQETQREAAHAFSIPVSWGEAPPIEHFLGRERELHTITHWIKNEACHIVAILGLGGIGKTTLGRMAAQQLQAHFKRVYWRSLQQTPTLEHFLEHYLQFIFQTRRANLPKDMDEQFSLLLTSLREQPCLLILDNFESILSTGQSTSKYKQGYEDYSRLLQLVGEADHVSCLLLTSREKPGEIARLERTLTTVRTMYLGGIEQAASQKLLQDLELYGSDEAQASLVQFYAGNPLALKLVAGPIRELFGGDITSFLREKEIVFGEITALLEDQFEPLGTAEKEVMYWLAIEREAISVHELRTKIVKAEIKGALLEIIESLLRRSLIELHDDGRLTLQSVVMEYTTRKFVECVVEEGASEKVTLFESHALMQAEAKDYVRLNQEQSILKDIAERLISTFGKGNLVKKLQRILSTIGATRIESPGYTAGNILNLLIHIQADLRSADFSSQTIRQAYLQGMALIDVNFADATFAASVFTDTFSSILCVTLSANGQLLAAGTTSGEIRLWQAETLTPLFTCSGHADGVRSLAFSPDGQLLVSGSEDHTLRIWDINTGQCMHILRGHGDQVYVVAFSPDGWTIASGSEDKTVRTWDAATGHCLAILEGHAARVRSLAISIDGNVLASGSEDTTIRLWNMSTGTNVAILDKHQAAVRAVAYNPQNNILATGSEDTTICLWDTNSLECITVLRGHTDLIRALAFSSDGKLLASSSDDQTISLWDTEAGSIIKVLHPQSNRIWSLAFFPGSTILISASESAREDDTLHYWEVRQGQCIHKLRGYRNLIKSVAFSPDGKTLVSGNEENDLRIWDIASGRCLKVFHEHINRIRSVAFSPDGRTVASGSEDETIRIWDTQAGLCRRVLQGHSHLVRSVAFSPDGIMLASGSHDRTIRLWDIKTGQCLRVLPGPGGLVWCVAFSPDGRLVASGNQDNMVYLWDIATGTVVSALQGHTHRVCSVAFSPDGNTLASASDDATLRTWDLHSRQCQHLFKGHELWVRSVAFSPDGNLLASGSHDHTVRIWNVHSSQCIRILPEHTSCVWNVAFSPDGQTLASCGDDGTIRLWDTASWACLKVLHSDRPYERMNISRTKGLTDAQKAALITLGAFEEDPAPKYV
jgi:WD40 repeat protein/ABC-type oligopeptide transport system ATPase subunit